MTTPKYKKNVKLDATLVHAAMRGLFVPCAIQLGMKPNEAFGRADWLKRQPEEYLDKVAETIIEIEKGKKDEAPKDSQ